MLPSCQVMSLLILNGNAQSHFLIHIFNTMYFFNVHVCANSDTSSSSAYHLAGKTNNSYSSNCNHQIYQRIYVIVLK